MARYRKKPVVIEAVQFNPLAEEQDEMLRHLEGCEGWQMQGKDILIPTLEGNHLAKPGDYVIRGVQGEYYPCKPSIFEETYEPVEPAN